MTSSSFLFSDMDESCVLCGGMGVDGIESPSTHDKPQVKENENYI